MQEDRFWLLVSLKFSGEATAEELAELDVLLQRYPELGLRLDIMHNIWQEKHQGTYPGKEDALNRHLQRLSNHFAGPVLKYDGGRAMEESTVPGEPRMVHRHYRWLWLVSGAAAAVIVFFLFFSKESIVTKTVQPVAQNTVSTKSGSKSKIQLPDGSQVWLNADSRLTYNETFSGVFREVQLTGEAYFDITKDKGHPFLIHTSSVDIRVLGTSLNVRSYTNEKNSETVLIRGSIEVTLRNNPDKKIILKPNEKLVVQNGAAMVDHGAPVQEHHQAEEPMMTLGKAHYKQKDSVATEVLWVKNKLAFDKETLESVALKIERWYDVKVIITDESLKDTEYSGVFEDENVRQVMEALRLSGNFKYSINKKEITIKP